MRPVCRSAGAQVGVAGEDQPERDDLEDALDEEDEGEAVVQPKESREERNDVDVFRRPPRNDE